MSPKVQQLLGSIKLPPPFSFDRVMGEIVNLWEVSTEGTRVVQTTKVGERARERYAFSTCKSATLPPSGNYFNKKD